MMGGRKSAGKIIGEALLLYGKNFKTFLFTALIAYGVAFLFLKLSTWVTGLLGLDVDSVMGVIRNVNAQQLLGGTGGVMLTTLLNVLLQLLVMGIWAALLSLVFELLSIPGNMLIIGAYDVMIGIYRGQKHNIREAARNFGKRWKRYLGMSAWSSLFYWLWTLVFFIPGIVKLYSYLLARFLVLDYPEMSVRQALRKSIEISKGYKGRLFGLAFIVGFIPVFLSLALGFVLMVAGQLPTYTILMNTIVPLANLLFFEALSYMVFAIAYLDIKQAAIEKGLLPGPDQVMIDNEPVMGEEVAPAQS